MPNLRLVERLLLIVGRREVPAPSSKTQTRPPLRQPRAGTREPVEKTAREAAAAPRRRSKAVTWWSKAKELERVGGPHLVTALVQAS